MRLIPVDYQGNVDWAGMMFGLFFFILIVVFAGFALTAGIGTYKTLTTCDRYDDNCTKPCEKYTLSEYTHGEVPYACATKAEEVMQRFK